LGWYRQTYAWVLEKPRILKRPVPYQHPSGAVIWARLDDKAERKILKELAARNGKLTFRLTCHLGGRATRERRDVIRQYR
jgi:hypothetical protein